jgi:RimJ/RimL family protein N-acetyltransferase
MGDAQFINKRVLDKARANTQKRLTVTFNRYTGSVLAKKNIEKFVSSVYRNFDDLSNVSELNHNEREIARLLTSSKSVIILGTIDGVIECYLIAEITIIENLKQLMHIYYLFTAPVYRGRGLSTRLLNLIQKYAKELNISTLSLTFDTYNKELERFYANNHFVYDENLRSLQRYDMMVKYI